ncbi:hypothetical protein ECZU17_60600 [Escherichia coli]|nr:hypothetical protein ECZU17_60600 [Escherichia coli]
MKRQLTREIAEGRFREARNREARNRPSREGAHDNVAEQQLHTAGHSLTLRVTSSE